jgi:branched-chain amino acid transport system substrate-binding protein
VAALLLAATAVYLSVRLAPDSHAATAPACGYKIGFVGPIAAGDPVPGLRDGAKLAVEQYNAAHTACTAQLVELDTTNNPLGEAGDAVADGRILGVVGPILEDEAAKVLPILEQAGIPAISPWLSDTRFAQQGYAVFHRTVGNNINDADVGAWQLSQLQHAGSTFVVDDRSGNGQEASSEVRRWLGAAAVAGSGSVQDGTDPSALASQIAGSGATTLFYGGVASAFAPLAKKLARAKPDLTILVDQWAFTTDLAGVAQQTPHGLYVTCPCMPTNTAARNFTTLFHSRFNADPPVCAAESFDAANVLLDGLANGNNTRAKMLSWTSRYDRQGVTGHIKFAGDGDLADPTVWVWHIGADGQYDLVGPVGSDRIER